MSNEMQCYVLMVAYVYNLPNSVTKACTHPVSNIVIYNHPYYSCNDIVRLIKLTTLFFPDYFKSATILHYNLQEIVRRISMGKHLEDVLMLLVWKIDLLIIYKLISNKEIKNSRISRHKDT